MPTFSTVRNSKINQVGLKVRIFVHVVYGTNSLEPPDFVFLFSLSMSVRNRYTTKTRTLSSRALELLHSGSLREAIPIFGQYYYQYASALNILKFLASVGLVGAIAAIEYALEATKN